MNRESLSPETRAAWGSRSLWAVLAGTVFLLLSGLLILLAPFGAGAQVTVLAHTGLGLAFLIPLGIYLGPHLWRRMRDRWSHLLLLGWISGILMLTACLTGVILTLQAAFGRRIDYTIDLIHIVTGCAVVAVLGAHLVTAVRRNRPGEWPFVLGLLGKTAAAGTLLTAVFFGGGETVPSPANRAPMPEKYGLRYGDNPFAPSLARTDRLYRVENDRRWVTTLQGGKAEEIDELLRGAERAYQADLECRRRGERHVEEFGGLETDARRIAELKEILKGAADRRPQRLAALLSRIHEEAQRNRAEFDREGGIPPEALAGSKSCGTSGCHEQIVAEWEPSAHRYASRSAFFQLIQGAMAESNGAESTRYCAGCHDPIALFSGAKNIYDEDLSSPGADEGISCAACHSIVRTDVQGNANYTVAAPEHYLSEEGFLGRFLIRAYPRHHKLTFGRPLLKTPEFCGACHKQFIDKELNRATRVQLQNQYDAWKGSHWFVADPKNPSRPDPEKALTCRDCHMRMRDSDDPAAINGEHRHHAFIAANQWLPALHGLPGAEEQIRLTEEWLQGKTVIPEIADRWPGGPPVPLQIEVPESVKPGEKVHVKVVADNRKVGHTFPTGPLDVIQAWIELKVTRGDEVIFRSGSLDEQGFIQPGSFVFKAEGVDRAGNLIDRHNLWDMVGSRFRRMLFPGSSDREEYTFDCVCETETKIQGGEGEFTAPEKGGELVVTALLQYRKVDQTLLNMLRPDGKSRAPVTTMTTATRTIRIERAP